MAVTVVIARQRDSSRPYFQDVFAEAEDFSVSPEGHLRVSGDRSQVVGAYPEGKWQFAYMDATCEAGRA